MLPRYATVGVDAMMQFHTLLSADSTSHAPSISNPILMADPEPLVDIGKILIHLFVLLL